MCVKLAFSLGLAGIERVPEGKGADGLRFRIAVLRGRPPERHVLLTLKRLRLGVDSHLLRKHVEADLQARQGRQFNPLAAAFRGAKPQFCDIAAANPQRITRNAAGPQLTARGVVNGNGQPLNGVDGRFSPGC